MEEETKGKGFVIKDRRMFTETGEARQEKAEAQEEKRPEPPEEPAGKPAEEARNREEPRREQPMPEMNFSNFVISLSTSVMLHFGDFPDPATKKAERNLVAAKQTIDILGMLKEKTKDNLEPDEQGLLDAMLFELRMRFVKEKDKE